jgi:hypothetical protein
VSGGRRFFAKALQRAHLYLLGRCLYGRFLQATQTGLEPQPDNENSVVPSSVTAHTSPAPLCQY